MSEDNIAGKIDDERFDRMSKQYTLEQKELAEKIAVISAQLEKQDAKAITADMFISTYLLSANTPAQRNSPNAC